MSVLVFAGVAIVVIVVVLVFDRRAREAKVRRSDAWREAAERLELSMDGVHHLSGTVDGFFLEVFEANIGFANEEQVSVTRISVDMGARVPAGLTLEGETIATRLRVLGGGDDVQVGERAFDDVVCVHSDDAWVRAVFDADTRKRVASLVRARQITLSNARLVWQTDSVLASADSIAGAVRTVIDVARRLSLRTDAVPGSLRRIARTDPVPGVRRQALETLLSRYADSSEALAAARAACEDVDDAVRLVGVTSLGRDSLPALERLLFELDDVSDEVLVRAFAHAADVADVEDRTALVQRGLEAEHVRLHAAAAAVAARHVVLEVVPTLRSLLAAPPSSASTPAVAAALGRLRDEASSARLLELTTCGEAAVEVAAIEALGCVGDLSAVEPLLARTRGVLVASDIKRAARGAVGLIQARHGGGEAGALTVFDASAEGALSVADAGGELTGSDLDR